MTAPSRPRGSCSAGARAVLLSGRLTAINWRSSRPAKITHLSGSSVPKKSQSGTWLLRLRLIRARDGRQMERKSPLSGVRGGEGSPRPLSTCIPIHGRYGQQIPGMARVALCGRARIHWSARSLKLRDRPICIGGPGAAWYFWPTWTDGHTCIQFPQPGGRRCC